VLGTVRAALPVSIIDVASSSAATDNDLAPWEKIEMHRRSVVVRSNG
jgi:hypothetical protein